MEQLPSRPAAVPPVPGKEGSPATVAFAICAAAAAAAAGAGDSLGKSPVGAGRQGRICRHKKGGKQACDNSLDHDALSRVNDTIASDSVLAMHDDSVDPVRDCGRWDRCVRPSAQRRNATRDTL